MISNITWIKTIIVSALIGLSYVVLKTLSQKDFMRSLIKDRLPKRIRNAL